MIIEEKRERLEDYCNDRYDCVSCPLKDTPDIDCCDFFECSDDVVEKAYNLVFGGESEKMTLRGFMKKYYPSAIDKCCNGGVMGCPSCYKELGNRFDMCDDCSGLGTVCEKCWSQEYEPQGTQREEINHPDRYAGGKFECIDVMVDVFGADAVKHFCILNAFKYVWRAEKKNGIEDIKKAVWYLNKYIELGGERNA